MIKIRCGKLRKLLPAALLLVLLAGCSSGGDRKTDSDNTGLSETSGNGMMESETETASELITEAVTEEMEYRNILEVLDEDTLSWVEAFDETKTDRLVYTIWGEEKEEYTITDPDKIRAFFDALTQLEVAGTVELYASDAGDTFDFYSDADNFRRFSFLMGSVEIDGVYYETDNADGLWDLTGELLGPM